MRKLLERGPEFPETIRRVLNGILAQMRDEKAVGADGQSMRVARQLALIGLAGELATQYQITGWKKGYALNAAKLVLRSWLAEREHRSDLVANAAFERIRAFLQVEADGFLEHGSRPTAGDELRHGWRDEDYFYFTSRTWKSINGREARKAARALVDAGFLLPGEEANLSRHSPNWVPDRPRLYWVRAEIMQKRRPAETAGAEKSDENREL